MALASEETLRRALGPVTIAFTWGGQATTAATLASYAPAWSAATFGRGQVVSSGGKAFGCITPGASAITPAGPGASIQMGAEAVRWIYLGGDNLKKIVIQNLDPTTLVYVGFWSGVTTIATPGTVGAAVPAGGGAWEIDGGAADLIWIVGTTNFCVVAGL